MNLALYLLRQVELRRKRRALARAEEWARSLEDQVRSGQHALYAALRRVDDLKAEVFALEDPADIVRRAGVA